MSKAKISAHQKKVLIALSVLEQHHCWDWWTRYAIGAVVDAGGFHGTIQIKTIAALKSKGLVKTERSSWPEGVRDRVRCGCACYRWGLTMSGRELVAGVKINLSERIETIVKQCSSELCGKHLDEDDAQTQMFKRMEEYDDDDE